MIFYVSRTQTRSGRNLAKTSAVTLSWSCARFHFHPSIHILLELDNDIQWLDARWSRCSTEWVLWTKTSSRHGSRINEVAIVEVVVVVKSISEVVASALWTLDFLQLSWSQCQQGKICHVHFVSAQFAHQTAPAFCNAGQVVGFDRSFVHLECSCRGPLFYFASCGLSLWLWSATAPAVVIVTATRDQT